MNDEMKQEQFVNELFKVERQATRDFPKRRRPPSLLIIPHLNFVAGHTMYYK